MTTSDWTERADALERQIRAGNISQAKETLVALSPGDIPRPLLARYAQLVRRCGQPLVALRWLVRFVRPTPRRPETPTCPEVLEYAASLIRLGALREARVLLQSLDDNELPRVLFESAAALIAEWRYAEAVAYLDRFVRHKAAEPYDRMVGKINLAAAFVHERNFVNASVLLREVTHDASLEGNSLLFANVMQLSAQLFFAQKRISEARQFLDQAGKRLEGGRELDRYFVKKWTAILKLHERVDANSTKAVRDARAEAESLGHWESCRDCDHYLATLTRDEALYQRVYFGTPYDGYRRDITAEFGDAAPPSDSYVWRATTKEPDHVLDTREETAGGSPTLRRLLLALVSDFYHPARLAALFEALHPGEVFDPTHSANRLHQSFRLLRQWLNQHAKGITIEEEDGNYRLKMAKGWGIRVTLEKPLLETEPADLRLEKLRQIFGQEAFNSRQAAEAIGISQRSAVRLLGSATEEARVERSGKRAAAKYRFR